MIGIAVLGAGGRGRAIVSRLLDAARGSVRVMSLYDPDAEQACLAKEEWSEPSAMACTTFEQAIVAPGVDWVVVASPNSFHRPHILAAFRRGKHVFCEKPLATTVDDCRLICAAHRQSGLTFATGFVLRYAPLYRRTRELLDEGVIGRIIAIDANENISPAHGGYIMANWRRKTELAGPHVLEKCVHDLDLLNWFVGELPARVAAFGGRDMFTPQNRHLETRYDWTSFREQKDPHRIETPFTDDSDLMDNLVAIVEYRNGVRVQFQATMSNPIPERRMYFSGTEGTLIAELYTGTLRYRRLDDDRETLIDLRADGHGGGDAILMRALFDTMTNGTPPLCSGDEGLESTVVALAIDLAARDGTVVDLKPIWDQLGR